MNATILSRRSGYSSRLLAILSYMGVLCLVPLATSKKDPYVAFHARQGVVIWMWEVLAVYTLMLPGVGKIFFNFTSIACLILSTIGMLAVLLGRAWRLPLVGSLAGKL